MSQRLRAVSAPTEDLDLVPGTTWQFKLLQRSHNPVLTSVGIKHTHGIHAHSYTYTYPYT